MKATINIEKNQEFVKAIDAMVSLGITEASLDFDTDGLHINSADAANTAMYKLHYQKDRFLDYTDQALESCPLLLLELKSILKKFKKGDVTIQTTQGEMMISSASDKGIKEFTTRLIELTKKQPRANNLQPTISITLPSEDFEEAITDVATDESTILATTGREFIISSKSNTRRNTTTLHVLKDQPVTKCRYSGEYLNKLVLKITPDVKIEFGSDYPLILTYETAGFKLQAILAPRVENE